jgi:transposase
MITKEHVMNIRSLIKQGYSQRQIARMTGLNRRTVRKYLQESCLPVYHHEQRPGKIEPYKPLIEGWLSKDDYQATKIHELLILQGFAGSYTTVRRFVQTLKERRDQKAYVRFETIVGQQAQVDFIGKGRSYLKSGLLIVDEVGYMPVERKEAHLFFQFVCYRYEKSSTIMTSNKSFGEWQEIFGDPVIATAILDRLLHHCHVINIKGNSYRLKEHKQRKEIPTSNQPVDN